MTKTPTIFAPKGLIKVLENFCISISKSWSCQGMQENFSMRTIHSLMSRPKSTWWPIMQFSIKFDDKIGHLLFLLWNPRSTAQVLVITIIPAAKSNPFTLVPWRDFVRVYSKIKMPMPMSRFWFYGNIDWQLKYW